MRIDIVSIFPEFFDVLHLSLLGKAISSEILDVAVHDLRTWTHDIHRTVDDTPYGGGAGMVMKPQPWGEALDHILATAATTNRDSSVSYEGSSLISEDAESSSAESRVVSESSTVVPEGAESLSPRPVLVVPTPSGVPFCQNMAGELSTKKHLVFACGRYEGIDHRVIEWAQESFDVREISLGDYVLNGGEVAALAMIEAIARLLPGVIGNPDSLVEESYSLGQAGLLEYPIYTKPSSWRGYDVPEVLLSGHHEKINAWRHTQSVELTRRRRPDLLS